MTNTVGGDSARRQKPWEMNLGDFLDPIVSKSPEKVFAEISGRKITYGQFQQYVLKTAGMFRGLGVSKGDRVCLFMPNCPEYLYCWFGLSILGAISVPVNTAYKRDETAYILNDAGAAAIVAHESLLPVASEAAGLAPSVRHKLVVENPPVPPFEKGGSGGISSGWNGFHESMVESSQLPARPGVAPDDISMLVYTSGTTGNPKGVMVSHQMYVAAGQGFAH